MKSKTFIGLAIAAVICVGVYTQLTVFVISPIGMLANGKTIIILRQSNTQFIDSLDSISTVGKSYDCLART